MAIALSLLFDRATADAVRAVWSALSAAGESRDMLDLGYPPHLTMVVTEDEALAPLLVRGLDQLARLAPETLSLGNVRQFEETSVTWVSVAGDVTALMRLHDAAAGFVPADAVHPHYRPGAWTPHVTLALSGTPKSLLRAASGAWTPRAAGQIIRLEVARFLPPQPLAGIDLPPK